MTPERLRALPESERAPECMRGLAQEGCFRQARREGTNADADFAMDMGMRLQLDPDVDCDARTTPVPDGTDGVLETRFLRMFCRTLQDYGMIMLDGTGPDGLVIYMENEVTAGWSDYIGVELWESYSYIVRDQTTPDDGLQRGPTDGIPWHKLRVLETSAFP